MRSSILSTTVIVILAVSICGCGDNVRMDETTKRRLLQWETEAPEQVRMQIELLRDGDIAEKRSALNELDSMGEGAKGAILVLFGALDHEDSVVVREAQMVLAKVGDPAVEPLMAALNDHESSIQEIAAEALVEIGQAATEPLIAALKDEDGRTRRSAIIALGRIGDTLAIEPLIASIRDEENRKKYIHFHLKDRAIDALVDIGEPAVDRLIAFFNNSEDIEGPTRCGVARALGRIGDSKALKPLLAGLSDDNKYVRANVCEALGNMGDTSAVDSLIGALDDYFKNVRGMAARALGNIGDVRAVDPLAEALGDDELWVRKKVAASLMRFGGPRVVAGFVEALVDGRSNLIAADMLTELGWQPSNKVNRVHFLIAQRQGDTLRDPLNWPDVKQVLLQDVQSGDRRRLELALRAFTGIGNKDALPDLLELIRKKGTRNIAEAYLNCNHAGLRAAAKEWARKNGYDIVDTRQHPETWNWGAW